MSAAEGKIVTITVKYGTYHGFVEVERYLEGGDALVLFTDTGEPLANVTEWVPGLGEEEVAINDYGGNAGMLEFALRKGWVEAPHRFVSSGYVTIPVCRKGPAWPGAEEESRE